MTADDGKFPFLCAVSSVAPLCKLNKAAPLCNADGGWPLKSGNTLNQPL